MANAYHYTKSHCDVGILESWNPVLEVFAAFLLLRIPVLCRLVSPLPAVSGSEPITYIRPAVQFIAKDPIADRATSPIANPYTFSIQIPSDQRSKPFHFAATISLPFCHHDSYPISPSRFLSHFAITISISFPNHPIDRDGKMGDRS